MYIDNKGLYANIQHVRLINWIFQQKANLMQEDVFDTYQVPFDSISRIRIGAASASMTPVALQLTAEPLVGATSEAEHKQCMLAFQLRNTDVPRFVDALKARGQVRFPFLRLRGRLTQRPGAGPADFERGGPKGVDARRGQVEFGICAERAQAADAGVWAAFVVFII